MAATITHKIRKLDNDVQIMRAGPGHASLWVNGSGELTLNVDGTPVTIGAGGGSGDVVGPDSSTDHAVARFDGAGGVTLQDSPMIVTDAGAVTGTISIDAAILGAVGAPVRLRGSLGTPAALANGDVWVEASGTTPDRTLALKVRDGGVTYTIAAIMV
jgi:hypothetical protein